MKFLFENESFSFETLRTAGYASYGGADLGEVLVTARGIPDGDEALWHQRWKALAERLHAVGTSALQAGDRVAEGMPCCGRADITARPTSTCVTTPPTIPKSRC